MNPLIVAEIGMNHMGDELYARQYLESLGVARPDVVTFQVREQAYYAQPRPLSESTLLHDSFYRYAARRTRELGMQFGVALCDVEKVPFFDSIGTDLYKILSKDIGNRELVAAVLKTGKPVFVSTGMSDEEEIWNSLIGSLHSPSNLSLIHTQLSYDDADTNLRAIEGLRKALGVPVAFGLHSTNVNALYASLGFFPSALFFYVRGECFAKHKDEDHAVPLVVCRRVIEEIRRLGTMMGDGRKKQMANRIKDQQK